MKFRLLAGTHQEGAKIYSAIGKEGHGPVVESERDLSKVFVNKFKKIEEGPKKSHRTNPPGGSEGESEDNADDAAGDGGEGSDQAGKGDQGYGDGGSESDGEGSESRSGSPAEPMITLKAKHRGRGRYDVVKVIDGEETDRCVNDGFLSKKEAKARVEEGWQD